MKLAEALLERADLIKKINILESRLISNSRVQEGLTVNENPDKLLKELDEKLKKLDYLITHINKTNENTVSASGETISAMLSRRDVLTLKLRVLGNFVSAGTEIINRVTHTEIRILPTFKVDNMQKKIDNLSQEMRKLDTSIQELNWTTELI